MSVPNSNNDLNVGNNEKKSDKKHLNQFWYSYRVRWAANQTSNFLNECLAAIR